MWCSSLCILAGVQQRKQCSKTGPAQWVTADYVVWCGWCTSTLCVATSEGMYYVVAHIAWSLLLPALCPLKVLDPVCVQRSPIYA